jgi:hypothetical protein
VTVKTDARAFAIEIVGVDTTDNSFALKMSIEAVVEETTDSIFDITLTSVRVTDSVTVVVSVFPNDLIILTALEMVALIVLVNALTIVVLLVILMVNEIRWNADSVNTTNTFSTTVDIVLAIALIMDAVLVTATDNSLPGSLAIEAIDVTTAVNACLYVVLLLPDMGAEENGEAPNITEQPNDYR